MNSVLLNKLRCYRFPPCAFAKASATHSRGNDRWFKHYLFNSYSICFYNSVLLDSRFAPSLKF